MSGQAGDGGEYRAAKLIRTHEEVPIRDT